MNYPCPICKENMTRYDGEKMHPNDPKFGLTLLCENQKCTAQEVMGHGDKAKDAYEVVIAKFVKREDREK